MTTVIITVLVEGSVCRAGGRRYLARSVNAAVGGEGDQRAFPTSANMLLPWKWTKLQWEKLDAESMAPAVKEEIWKDGLEKWVNARLSDPLAGRPQLYSLWPTTMAELPNETYEPDERDPEDPERTMSNNPDDTTWRDTQSWVMLQMQLARMDARISHGLKLCHVVEFPDETQPGAELLKVASIAINGRTFDTLVPPSSLEPPLEDGQTQGYFIGDADFDIVFNVITDDRVEDLEQIGFSSPIDWKSRRVNFDRADASDGDWLADAEEKIEAQCDPVLALLKIGAAADKPLTIDAKAFRGAMRAIIESSPDAILLSLMAADDVDDTNQVDDWKKAKDWSKAIKASPIVTSAFRRLEDQLHNPATQQQYDFSKLENRERLRAFWVPTQVDGREDFAGYLLDGIIAAGRTVKISDAVLVWLAREEASEILMGRLLPSAVSRKVLQRMAEGAVGQAKDREPFKDKFVDSFCAEMALLLKPGANNAVNIEAGLKKLAEGQNDRLFERDTGAGDLGTRDGLTVPVDAIFVAAADFDPHEVLDGYHIAIRQTNNPTQEGDAWRAVTRGTVSCLGVTVEEPLLVPNPPAIEQGAYLDDSRRTERRHVLVPYIGTSVLPHTLDEGNQPVLSYKSMTAADLPELAFGGMYEVAVGYQGLGGLLPDGFFDGDDPLTFAIKDPRGSIRSLPFMRTMIPGAPDLRGEGVAGEEPPPIARLWEAAEDSVRPLWKEVADVGDKQFEDARRQARTKFLSLDAGAAVGSKLEFTARPPNLPKAPDSSRPRADAVLRYWRKRDAQLGIASSTTADKEQWAPDPAVVGSKSDDKNGPTTSKGGIRVRVYDPKSPTTPEIHDVVLGPGEALVCRITVGQAAIRISNDRTLEVVCPQGASRVLVLTSLVDKDFAKGGSDPRFADNVLIVDGEVAEAGSVSLAVEALPERNHLPSDRQLWDALEVTQAPDNAVVFGMRQRDANPDPWGVSAENPFKYVSDITCEWQEWRWDGGPIRPDELPGDGTALTVEAADAANFANFDTGHFTNRGSRGASTSTPLQLRSPQGSKSLPLLTRPGSPNMGATYYRARLAAKSRYASLIAAQPSTPADPNRRKWRGAMVPARRIDPLPTPQIAGLIPLGGRVRRPENADPVEAGAFALVLDTPWYDTRAGAGLQAQLECEIIWEKDGAPGFEAAAISPLPNLFGTVNGEQKRQPQGELKTLDKDEMRIIRDVGVLGLTRDRGSAIAIYTGALAFFDALINEKMEIPSDYTARLRCRATVPHLDLSSAWSQALLIEFEPAILENVLRASRKLPEDSIAIAAGTDGEGLLKRWVWMLADSGNDQRIMRHGLSAMLFKETTNFIGEKVLRVVGAGDVSIGDSANGLVVTAKIEQAPTHVRIFETLRHDSKPISGNTSIEQLTTLAGQLLPPEGSGCFEPHQALIRVGPLVRIDEI